MNDRASLPEKEISRYRARTIPSPMRAMALISSFAILALGCNSDDTEAFSINGTWTGEVVEADTEFSLLLIKDGKNGIDGTALVTAPPEGQVPGTVHGAMEDDEVTFTISIEEAVIGGSIVFEGAFQSEDVLFGTVSSGILGGSFPVTFQRQGA